MVEAKVFAFVAFVLSETIPRILALPLGFSSLKNFWAQM